MAEGPRLEANIKNETGTTGVASDDRLVEATGWHVGALFNVASTVRRTMPNRAWLVSSRQ